MPAPLSQQPSSQALEQSSETFESFTSTRTGYASEKNTPKAHRALRFVKNTRNAQGYPLGELHGMAKLSEDLVRKIRKSNRTCLTWAVMLGVGVETVRDARNGRTWKHVK